VKYHFFNDKGTNRPGTNRPYTHGNTCVSCYMDICIAPLTEGYSEALSA